MTTFINVTEITDKLLYNFSELYTELKTLNHNKLSYDEYVISFKEIMYELEKINEAYLAIHLLKELNKNDPI